MSRASPQLRPTAKTARRSTPPGPKRGLLETGSSLVRGGHEPKFDEIDSGTTRSRWRLAISKSVRRPCLPTYIGLLAGESRLLRDSRHCTRRAAGVPSSSDKLLSASPLLPLLSGPWMRPCGRCSRTELPSARSFCCSHLDRSGSHVRWRPLHLCRPALSWLPSRGSYAVTAWTDRCLVGLSVARHPFSLPTRPYLTYPHHFTP